MVDYKKTICKSPGCLDCKPDNDNCVKCDSSKGYIKLLGAAKGSPPLKKGYCKKCDEKKNGFLDPETGRCLYTMEFKG